MKVLELVQAGRSKADAYLKVNVDRNTIVNQAPIAELQRVNSERFKKLRSTFKHNGSLHSFANLCSTFCATEPEASKIVALKKSNLLLDILRK